MSNFTQYRVHDAHGNMYGPADVRTLQEWAREGRIVPGMSIAEEGTQTWVEVSTHPIFAGMFGMGAAAMPGGPANADVGNAGAWKGNPEAYSTMPGQEMNVMALISMISGIAAIAMSCCCGLLSVPLGLGAIVMGIVALVQINREPNRYTGKGMAVAGLICGGLAILVTIGMFAVSLAINLSGARGGGAGVRRAI